METWKGCTHKTFDWWWQPRKGVHRSGSYLCDRGVWERWIGFHISRLGSALQCLGQLQLWDSTCPGLRSLCWLVRTKQKNHYYLGLQQEGIEDIIVTWHHQFIWISSVFFYTLWSRSYKICTLSSPSILFCGVLKHPRLQSFPRGLGKGSDAALVSAWLHSVMSPMDESMVPDTF